MTYQPLTVTAKELRMGDHVDMQPVYEDFEETGTGDYQVAQFEFGDVYEVGNAWFSATEIQFTNLSTWFLPDDYALSIERDHSA